MEVTCLTDKKRERGENRGEIFLRGQCDGAIFNFRSQRQADPCGFKANLVYITNSGLAGASKTLKQP